MQSSFYYNEHDAACNFDFTMELQQHLQRLGLLLESLVLAATTSSSSPAAATPSVGEDSYLMMSHDDEVMQRRRESSIIIDEAVEILQLHPEFALEEFEVAEQQHGLLPANTRCIPLKIFLLAGAMDLNLLEKVCDLNPESLVLLSENDAQQQTVLHFACHHCCCYGRVHDDSGNRHHTNPEDTLIFLAQKCPEALKLTDSARDFPLSVALKKGSSLKVIQAFVDLYPKILNGCHEDAHGNIPLGTAIAYICQTEVIHFLTERLLLALPRSYHAQSLSLLCTRRYTTTTTTTTTAPHDRENSVIDLNISKVLIKLLLLPQFERINFQFSGWTNDGLAYFLKHLKPKKTMKRIDELTLPYDMISTNPELQLLLKESVQRNTGIERLRLAKCVHDGNGDNNADTTDNNSSDDAPLLRSIGGAGVINYPRLQPALEIEDLCLPDIQCLIDELLSDIAPTNLKLVQLKLADDSADRYDERKEHQAINSKVQYLNLSHSMMSPGCYNPLFKKLSKLPCLKSLDVAAMATRYRHPRHHGCGLFFTDTPVITESLVTLFESAPCLESVTLDGFDCDHAAICLALRQNTTVGTFVMHDMKYCSENKKNYRTLLQNHNATLKRLHSEYSNDPLIHQYLTLNRWGRARARHPHTTISQLVQLLSEVPLHKHDLVMFGLLIESPTVWCNALDPRP